MSFADFTTDQADRLRRMLEFNDGFIAEYLLEGGLVIAVPDDSQRQRNISELMDDHGFTEIERHRYDRLFIHYNHEESQ